MEDNTVAAISALEKYFPKGAEDLLEYLLLSNKRHNKLENWRQQQLTEFLFSITLNADELSRGFVEKRIMKIAWAARNLLEVMMWVIYCNQSMENATRFRDDSARDLLGISKAFQGFFEREQGSPSKELAMAMQGIVATAEKAFGVSGIEDGRLQAGFFGG
jgi:hypothetical protein